MKGIERTALEGNCAHYAKPNFGLLEEQEISTWRKITSLLGWLARVEGEEHGCRLIPPAFFAKDLFELIRSSILQSINEDTDWIIPYASIRVVVKAGATEVWLENRIRLWF